jgi:conjugative transposon TraJ protein
MKRKGMPTLFCVAVGLIVPVIASAQTISGWADDIKSLHSVLDQIYDEMLPLCSELIGVGRGIAGFAAVFYIGYRVWGHLARAESIDFYPLFRPFVIGAAILMFPSVIALINGVLSPTVSGTSAMVTNSDAAIAALLQQKEDAVKNSPLYEMYVGDSGFGDRDKWYKYTHEDADPSDEGWLESIGNDIRFAMAKASYNFRNAIKEVMSEILQLLFAAASLAINTMRTFRLIILAILGPLVFGLSVFDGFHHTLRHWLARYINVFLWLPVANIFGAVIGKIQENMLKIDIGQVQNYGDTFFSKTDIGYMIFMIIGIMGYFTVPDIANQILWVGGGDALTSKTTGMFTGTVSVAGSAASSAVSKMVK